jgi:hypothetical protein
VIEEHASHRGADVAAAEQSDSYDFRHGTPRVIFDGIGRAL